jgi:DNA-binding NarL/FixJ family response regulator
MGQLTLTKEVSEPNTISGTTTVDLSVVIIEDNVHYRRSLETLLNHAKGFRCIASYGSAQAALEEVENRLRYGQEISWKMILMDIDLPGMNGIEATRRLKTLVPNLSVVMLTVFEEPTTILEAITVGADGYLLKKTLAPEILSQLGMIAAGGSPLTPDVARTVLSLLRSKSNLLGVASSSTAPTKLDLTEREQQVLQCLVKGLAYKQAADYLGISIDTVRTHIRGVYRKLQVHSVAEAVARAIREKIV